MRRRSRWTGVTSSRGLVEICYGVTNILIVGDDGQSIATLTYTDFFP